MMATGTEWPTKTAGSWDEYLAIIQELDDQGGDFVYRGQIDVEWDLSPTLARITGQHSVAVELEPRIYNTFRGRSPEFLSPNLFAILTRDYNLLLWWAVMRHYGAPTRILDWSRSPFVACYFACESGKSSGAVWCVRRDTLVSRMRAKHGSDYAEFLKFLGSKASVDEHEEMKRVLFDAGKPSLVHLSDTNFLPQRMERQQGLFSYSNQPTCDHAEVIRDALQEDGDGFLKVIIPEHMIDGQKRRFMHQLQLMNVTGFSLFPDLDGVGRYCTDIARNMLKPK